MNLRQLLKEAQFHGCNRLADRKHRLWWTLALFLALGASSGVILGTVWRYFENPTFMTILPDENKQPFPAVHICPEILFPDHRIAEFLSKIKYPVGISKKFVKTRIFQIAAFYSPDVSYRLKDLLLLESVLSYNKLDIQTAAEHLTSSCEETLIRCRWLGIIKNCSEIFTMEMTRHGFCCVFNGRSLRRDLNMYGIHKVKPPVKYFNDNDGYIPTDLTVAVNQSQKPDDVDLSYKWLTLENGQDYVETAKNGTPLSPGYEMWAEFGLRRFKIDEDAGSLSSNLRHCQFSAEPLKYFPIYKKNYCLFECEIERFLRSCQCLMPFHPRIPGTVYCHATSILCAKHASVPYDTDQCECPPTCDTDKDFLRSQSFKLINTSAVLDNFFSGLDFENVTVVKVYFRSRRARVFSRRSYYSYLNLFAQLGGAFNLFFGCSVLTVLELLQLLWHGSKKLFSKPRVKGSKPPVANKRPSKKNKHVPQKHKKGRKVNINKVRDY